MSLFAVIKLLDYFMIDKNKDSKNSFWQRFSWLFSFGGLLFLNILITGVLGGTFWYFFGTIRIYNNLKIGTVDNYRQYSQDFLSVFGSIFTIIGYGLTIYQIWKLRTEQEAMDTARKEAKFLSFMESTLESIGKAKNSLKELRSRIEKANSFTEDVVRGYIDELVEVKEILTKIDVNKKALDDSELCKSCHVFIDICIAYFSDTVTDKKTDQIDKVASKGQINALIQELIKIHPQL